MPRLLIYIKSTHNLRKILLRRWSEFPLGTIGSFINKGMWGSLLQGFHIFMFCILSGKRLGSFIWGIHFRLEVAFCNWSTDRTNLLCSRALSKARVFSRGLYAHTHKHFMCEFCILTRRFIWECVWAHAWDLCENNLFLCAVRDGFVFYVLCFNDSEVGANYAACRVEKSDASWKDFGVIWKFGGKTGRGASFGALIESSGHGFLDNFFTIEVAYIFVIFYPLIKQGTH